MRGTGEAAGVPHVVASACARAAELTLIVLGLFFVFGEWTEWQNFYWMLAWVVIAGLYVAAAVVVLRGSRHRRGERLDSPPSAMALRWRYGFTLAVSLTALGGAATVLISEDLEVAGAANKLMSVLLMILAWLLLHGGYARFYAGVFLRDGRAGFDFPGTPDPSMVDMLYFSLAVGTTFAATDVDVTTRSMRWHVMVHGVLAFFYNAAILALAIGALTGK